MVRLQYRLGIRRKEAVRREALHADRTVSATNNPCRSYPDDCPVAFVCKPERSLHEGSQLPSEDCLYLSRMRITERDQRTRTICSGNVKHNCLCCRRWHDRYDENSCNTASHNK